MIGVSSMPSPPLSVEGHAHRLIDEAVCKERLGKMYIWCVAGRRASRIATCAARWVAAAVGVMARPGSSTLPPAHVLAFCP